VNNKGQFSIIAALLVAIILVATVITTYSAIRNNPVQSLPQVMSAIDEINLALKQVLGFTVGYYGSVLEVTGNSSYGKILASSYLQSGLQNIANMRPEWGASFNVSTPQLQASWFMNASFSTGNMTASYNLTGLGLYGVTYQTSCTVSVQVMNNVGNQACLNVIGDGNQPLVGLTQTNFWFYNYTYANSTWQLASPSSQPIAYGNGTYLINIPTGVNPYSYVIQVQDPRGIIVVASSFNTYTCALTWNSTSTNAPQTLYAHQETTSIGGSTYYLLKNSTADASGTTLNASAGSTGRQLMGAFVYPLTGVSIMPASTWTANYRAWTDSGSTIAFDNSSSGNNTDGSSSTFSWSHKTGSGANRIMIVGVSVKLISGNEVVSSVSYGTQSLTFLRADVDSGSNVRSEIWYLIGPNTGTNNVTVNLSTNQKASGGSATYSGVFQTPPVLADSSGGSGSSSSPSASISLSTSNSFLVSNLAVRLPGNQVPTVTLEGTGQTMRWDNATQFQSPNSNNRSHGSEMGPVNGSQTMSWTLSGSADWAVSIVALKPVPPSVHGDIDISIRQSNGTSRTTIATNVAPSANLTSIPTTLSGTYSWANYTVVNQTDYLEIDYYADVTTAMSGTNAHLRIDDTALSASNQTSVANVLFPVDLYSVSQQGTVVVELLQNGTMRWLGQNLGLTSQANSSLPIPIPPMPIRSMHLNETINGINSETPFQIEDWASGYTVPLGLGSNGSLFDNRKELVFLVNNNVSGVTIWWNGSDLATQTPFAYTDRYFSDNTTTGTLTNGQLTIQINTAANGFPVVSTVGTSSCTANFMRINTNSSNYGSPPAYVITNGVIRDIIHQEAEWSNQTGSSPGGVINCSDIYADIVLTLPANATYYTYQLSLMFVQSQLNRTITDLCPINLTSVTGQIIQTENGTANGLPIISNATASFYNYSISSWAHHWSQAVSGTNGAGIMFTDSANQELYAFDAINSTKTGALGVTNSTASTMVQLLPVNVSQVSFTGNTTLDTRMLDMIWQGAVVTFNSTTPIIYNSNNQTGLWIIVEYPPTVQVTTGI